jgi:CAAX protease family protein
VTSNIHFPADGAPGPIWRFLISALLVFVAYLIVGIILGISFNLLGLHPGIYLTMFLASILTLAAILGIYKVLCTVMDDKPLAFVGLAFHSRWKAELFHGAVLGAAMMIAVAALERVFGGTTYSWMLFASASPAHVLKWALFSLVIFSAAGACEELTFRGYPFQRLVDSIGPAGGVAVFAALFGLVHLGNYAHTWLSTLNTALVGVGLAVAYLRTRSLWLPIGLHVAWNFFQGYVFGFPVSGTLLPVDLVRPEYPAGAWLTGGAYGPEASLLSTGVIVLGTVYLLFSKSIYVSQEMKKLVFASGPAGGSGAAAPGSPEGGPG